MNSTKEANAGNEEINIYYTICELLVAIIAIVGNALVIYVFRKERRLRRRTNYYIVSLAAADFLVGLLGIPFAIMSSIGLPSNLHACLFTVSLLVVLCTISIFSLVAVSVDRYWAILHPMGYSRNVRTKTAIVIISICWILGGIVGFLPLLGWHKDAPSTGRCFFLDVMDYNYLVFLYFGTIITPALLLAAFYVHIYQVVLKQLRQIVTMNPEPSSGGLGSSGGTMLRMLGAAQKREVKATKNLSIIVLFFMICWFPLYTINCVLAFCHECHVNATFMLPCIILSHLNSAGNPLLYAYHLKDFRAALRNFFCHIFGYTEQPIPGAYQTTWASSRLAANGKCRRNDFALVPKISTIVKNSATLGAAPSVGEVDSKIWDIAGGSGSSSAESVVRMVRPATPYRPRNSSGVNQGFVVDLNSSDDDRESDDVFLPLNAFSSGEMEAMAANKSVSSPQLAKNLFYIDCEYRQCVFGNRFSKSVSSEVDGVIVNRKRRFITRSLSDNGLGFILH